MTETRGASPILWLDEVDSTNSECLRRATSTPTGELWIGALSQTGGRGRSGRRWRSPPGNLYLSCLLRLACPPAAIVQLSLVAGIAVHEAITRAASLPPDRAALRLKWPNDVLWHGAKLAGILIESSLYGDGRADVVIGLGVNLVSHPKDLGRPATDLAAAGYPVTRGALAGALRDSLGDWRRLWRDGEGIGAIRTAWLSRAAGVGQPVSVQTHRGAAAGLFHGLDADGALLLSTDNGRVERVTFGDVTIIGDLPHAH